MTTASSVCICPACSGHCHEQTNWLQPGNTPSSDDTTSSLNVIIEAEVLVAHLFQDGEGLVGLEVLKLDEAVGEAMLSCCTELLHHLHVLLTCQPLLLAALHSQVKVEARLCGNEWLCSNAELLHRTPPPPPCAHHLSASSPCYPTESSKG